MKHPCLFPFFLVYSFFLMREWQIWGSLMHFFSAVKKTDQGTVLIWEVCGHFCLLLKRMSIEDFLSHRWLIVYGDLDRLLTCLLVIMLITSHLYILTVQCLFLCSHLLLFFLMDFLIRWIFHTRFIIFV